MSWIPSCCLQGLNISPNLIIIGPYDTTVAGQVGLFSSHIAFLHLPLLLGKAPLQHVLRVPKAGQV